MEVKNVSYKIGDNLVLNNISLDAAEGKIIGILGSGGSGKSSLISIMSGLNLPNDGEVIYNKSKVTSDKIIGVGNLRKNVGVLYQNLDDQFFLDTVREELEFALREYKVDDIDKRVKDSLKMVGLDEEYLNKDPMKLSSGEKRLVGLSMILSFNPKVFLLDEPLYNLDGLNRKKVIKLLKLMKNRYKKTIVIATNDSDLLLEVANRIYVLNKEKIVLEGTKYKVLKNDLTKYDINIPKIINFNKTVNDLKGIDIGYRDNMNDLMKDIYRYVRK